MRKRPVGQRAVVGSDPDPDRVAAELAREPAHGGASFQSRTHREPFAPPEGLLTRQLPWKVLRVDFKVAALRVNHHHLADVLRRFLL